MSSELTPMEFAVLQAQAAPLPFTERTALNAQVAALMVKSRTNTGAGLITEFEFATPPSEKIRMEPRLCNVEARIPGLDVGLRFSLTLRDGFLYRLEGLIVGNHSTWGLDPASAEFELLVTPDPPTLTRMERAVLIAAANRLAEPDKTVMKK